MCTCLRKQDLSIQSGIKWILETEISCVLELEELAVQMRQYDQLCWT